MLRELRIENLGVVVDAQIEFKGKFTVLTGETGAGKTINGDCPMQLGNEKHSIDSADRCVLI